MSFSIQIDHGLRIIRYTHSGLIKKKEEIGEAWDELLSLKEFTEEKYNLLSDYRESKFDIPLEDIELISEHLYQMRNILQGKKQSLVLNDPQSTAMSILFEKVVQNKFDFRIKVFSTLEGATQWHTDS